MKKQKFNSLLNQYNSYMTEDVGTGHQVFGLFFDGEEGQPTLLGIYSSQQKAQEAEAHYGETEGEYSAAHVKIIPLGMDQSPSHQFVNQ